MLIIPSNVTISLLGRLDCLHIVHMPQSSPEATLVYCLSGDATMLLYNICTMLDQRRRRWPDVVQMLYKYFVLASGKCLRWSYDCYQLNY